MATTTKSSSSSRIDPRIYHPLGKLSGAIRRYVAFEGLATVCIFLASWFWLGLLLDFGLFRLTSFDWVVDAHKGFRIVALVAVISALLALVVTRLVIRLTRDFSARSLALVLEKRFPDLLGDRLITAVELADTKKAAEYGYSEEMILETIHDARDRVDRIPVGRVFNWKRLWLRIGLVFALSAGIFAAVSTAIVLIYSLKVARYFSKFADVSMTWAERNILLQDVPWPRNTHLEILEPTENDKHIGRDKPELTVRAVAYKWVWADPSQPAGWRPLTWADVPAALTDPESIPALPIEPLKAVVKTAPFLTGTLFNAAPNLELPSDLADLPEDPSAWRVDRLEILLTKNEKLKAFLTTAPKGKEPIMTEEEIGKFLDVFDRLAERADDPSMSRKLRQLEIPATAVLYYRGENTKGEKAAEPDKYNEFKFQLTNLQESVTYRIRGGDFSTPERKITLVPAPTLIGMTITEWAPAYHFYLPPKKDDNALTTNPQLLKNLRQIQSKNPSVAGARSAIPIFTGSDLVIEAETDKELLSVSLTPTIGLFPGVDSTDQSEPIPLKLQPGRKSFSLSFNGKGKPLNYWQKEALTLTDRNDLPDTWDPVLPPTLRPVEFELAFTDTDKVTSRRTFSIQLQDDRGPEVNVAISGLRKIGGVYLCSANANIPWTTDSNVRDDFGLHKVEYDFSYSRIEPRPNPDVKVPTPTAVEQRAPIPDFETQYKKQAKKAIFTLSALEAKLKEPRPDNFSPFTTYYQFGVDETFDLMKRLPTLASGDPQTQSSYNLLLNVVATDSNVLFGPRTAQNKDAIAIRVVPYSELLSEISRDQKELATIMDESIKKLETCQRNLTDVAIRAVSLNASNVDDLSVRGSTIQDDMTRSNELLIRVLTGYRKIVEEYQINRFEKYKSQLIPNTRSLAIKPMEDVLEGMDCYYSRAEAGISRFQNLVKQTIVPDPITSLNAQQRLHELIEKVKAIRGSMGTTLKLESLLKDFEDLVKRAEFLETDIRRVRTDEITRTFNFTFPGLPSKLSIKRGESLKLTLQVRLPRQLLNDPSLKFAGSPGSELTITPATAVLKEQPIEQEMVLAIKAGNAIGTHKLSIIPSQNKGREIEVIVTP